MPLRRRILLPLATLLLLASCQKDEAVRWLEVTVEPYAGSKVAVDGATATWVDGETIRINSTTAVIHRRSNNGDHAYIDATAAAAVNRALYPASLADGALTSDAVTIHLPATYRYRTDGSGHQLLEVPLAARATDDQPLEFKHLTGALSFTIVNNIDTPIALDSLCVESDAYGLSGSRPLNFVSIGSQAPVAAASAADRKVALLFEDETLAASASLTVVLPIAPVGADNHFTVRVSARHQGTRYTYSRSQATGGALVRNEIGYAQTPLSTETTTTGPIFEIKEIANLSCQFKIKSPSDFLLMAEAVTNQWQMPYIIGVSTPSYYNTQSYILTTDLDMTDVEISPITNFTGKKIDGGGHGISNLSIDGSNGFCGLFKSAVSSLFCNLTLSNISLRYTNPGSGSEHHIAPLICDIRDVSIQNCTIDGVNIYTPGDQGKTCYGGMVAYARGEDTIETSQVIHTVNISQTSGIIYYGGLLGYMDTDGSKISVNSCSVNNGSSSVSGTTNIYFGGLIGYYATTTLKINTFSWEGSLSATNTGSSYVRIGGLIGRAATNASIGSATLCTLTGNISCICNHYIGTYAGQAAVGFSVAGITNSTYSFTLNGESYTREIGYQ